MDEERIFRMPSLGADMTDGAVLEWLVHPGDRVRRGDLVAVIKTDKADVEVEVFDDGIIGELLVPESDARLPIGTPLATIVDVEAPHTVTPPVEPAVAPTSEPTEGSPATPTATSRTAVSPYARRRAAELGVDLSRVAPPDRGRPISAADVEQAAATARPEQGLADRTGAMRRAIGNLMARSKREIPHFYLDDDIEMSHPLAWLSRHNAAVPVEQRILPAALLYKTVALAARDVPACNGFYSERTFVPGDGVHLGVAIGLRGGGVVAPAIRNADQLALDELMDRLRDLTARVRGGRLRGSEMTDATITVTNLGDRGVRAVYGVIYPPQVALVGFGKISDRVWDANGGLGIRPVVTATLAADHRVVDGLIGARLLAGVARHLNAPEEL